MTFVKYIVLLCDGMADRPLEELGGKTPMTAAVKPNMDTLARQSVVGMVKTVADGLKPGSDVANLSVMGYDPFLYYSGRSPLEAGSIGIDMKPTDVSFRCNLVTLSDEEKLEDRILIDYCADDISTEEARELVKALAEHFNSEEFQLYSGISYRHCLIWNKGTTDVGTLTPPHDITGKPVRGHLSTSENAAPLLKMMEESYHILKDHPVNKARIERGLRPANSCWFWGEGVRKPLPKFKDKFGLDGAVISAVDLIKGIGKFAEMKVVELDGVTGYIDTDFDAKANAAIEELKDGRDFVYIHVEAPDECGHRHEIENKVRAIELIDEKILGAILNSADEIGDFKIMILPDHPTPLSLRTHTSDSVPFMIFDSTRDYEGVECFDEIHAEQTGIKVDVGHTIMKKFLTE